MKLKKSKDWLFDRAEEGSLREARPMLRGHRPKYKEGSRGKRDRGRVGREQCSGFTLILYKESIV